MLKVEIGYEFLVVEKNQEALFMLCNMCEKMRSNYENKNFFGFFGLYY